MNIRLGLSDEARISLAVGTRCTFGTDSITVLLGLTKTGMRSVHEMRRQTGLACNYDVGLTGVLACSRMCCLPCVFWRLAEGWEHDRPAVRLLAAGRRAGIRLYCRRYSGGWPQGGNMAGLPCVFWRLATRRALGPLKGLSRRCRLSQPTRGISQALPYWICKGSVSSSKGV